MERITLKPLGDLDAVERRWRALESESDGGFFRSWTFLGCDIAQRFVGAQLLSVTQDGADVALGILGKANGRFWLNQTGSPILDAPFIEHNGLLIRRGHQESTITALRHAARFASNVVLAGVDDSIVHMARSAGLLVIEQSRYAPYVTLHTLTKPFLEMLSANARAQIRRSMRAYGPEIVLKRADSLSQALDWFDTLVALHQASWIRRGQPGAFATAVTCQFHETLIARCWPCGTADLLKVESNGRVIGVLYCFVHNRRVLSYQSGFAYVADRPREKPGLVCHALAIQHYADREALTYDLLAGADRYKQTLANAGMTLHWATLYRRWSVSGALALIKHLAVERTRHSATC